MNMKENIGKSCIVDNKHLGLINDVRDGMYVVMMLKEDPAICAEALIEPERITLR